MSSCFDNGVLLTGADCLTRELEMQTNPLERQRVEEGEKYQPHNFKPVVPLLEPLVPPIDHTLPDFKPMMPESEPVGPLIDFQPKVPITTVDIVPKPPIGTKSSWLNRFGADTASDVMLFHERRKPDTSLVDFTIQVTPRYEPPDPFIPLPSRRFTPSVDLSPSPADRFPIYDPPTNPFRSRDDNDEYDPILNRYRKKDPFSRF